VRFSKVVSYGNASDLDEIDLLDYLADDPETEIIGAYLEGAKEVRGWSSNKGSVQEADHHHQRGSTGGKRASTPTGPWPGFGLGQHAQADGRHPGRGFRGDG
jgi:3-hydroxypropionyl-CoA synthetase (ADP-forming)